MNRRDLLQIFGALALSGASSSIPAASVGRRAGRDVFDDKHLIELDSFIWTKMERDHIPGVAACILQHDDMIWSETYGWCNLDNRSPMTLETIQNVASISKTVTTTAIMQLEEAGLLKLDDDVNEYCSFPVRHPRAQDQSISLEHLMTHTSAISDGPAYSRWYACGDPRLALEPWLREYFTPGGRFYDEKNNFHAWTPKDRKFTYCNLAYGLLGHVVSIVSGIPFPEYCRLNIFAPLDMASTSWRIADIDERRHVVPYTWVEKGSARGPDWGGIPLGAIRQDGPSFDVGLDNGFAPNCIYGHPNYPDGFLRTTVGDLSRYVRAYIGRGAFDGHRILANETVQRMLTPALIHESQSGGQMHRRRQGLTWSADILIEGELAWGHGGSDPGVNTDMRILPDSGLAAIVFTNTNGVDPWDMTRKLLEVAASATL